MATIRRRQRADGSSAYQVGYRQDGKLKWSGTLDSGEDAARLKEMVERIGPDAALAIVKTRSRSNARELSLAQWFDKHLELLAASATPGTIDGYRKEAARTWLIRIGDYPLSAITREVVTEWVAWQRRQETARSQRAREKARQAIENGHEDVVVPKPAFVSPKTIRNAHGLLSSVLASAVEAGHIVKNTARGTSLPSDQHDAEMEILTEAEWLDLRDHIPAHWQPLTTFLIVIGCRIGEATAVKAKDVDLARGTVRIRRAWKKGEKDARVIGSTKTRRGVRTVVMGRHLTEVLRPLVEKADAEAFVFTAPQGGRVYAQHYRNRVWQTAITAAGITKHVTPHGLRHTSASWLLMAGESPQVVQHRLGHESLATTSKVYAHLLTDAQLSAAAVMDAAARPRQIEGSKQ